ncbi:insulinase family protein [Xinfangfangia sp. D13-10-4-6]|uniref:M16 family metallopeptidase n=1 Tax=Pseudogemmobacter hezensis TaxID=2737662 RepID=UPI001552B6E9|nr:pitrilysin family protein [Pseudogemmobacter hezensis]NPD13889.1 insulinase family protein [Pseudogemmobacter hezensis]
MILRAFVTAVAFALPSLVAGLAPGLALADIAIKEVKSPGGLTAWLVEDHNIPFTALEIRFRGGTSLDDPAKRGAINLMAGLIEEGAGELDSKGFAEARDGLAASYSFAASSDSVSVSARFLTENRDQAVDLLALALNKPRFDEDAVARVREQVLSGLRSDERNPTSIASRVFDGLAYGDHPYAYSGRGSLDSVAALTRDDVVAAWKAALARDRVYISAAGDITSEELGLVIDRILGGLPESGAPLPQTAPWLLTPGVSVVDFPSPQSVVVFGQSGISQDDPDFFAAYILNEVMGGGRFSARLMTEVRDRRGLTYGIGSYLVGMDHSDSYLGQFQASNDKVAEAISVIRAEWAKIAAEGISEKELTDAKTYLTGAYPLRFDGNAPIASLLVGMQMQGMAIDYPNSRNARVEAVTMADVKRVAARLYQPEALRFVVVGRPEGVDATP